MDFSRGRLVLDYCFRSAVVNLRVVDHLDPGRREGLKELVTLACEGRFFRGPRGGESCLFHKQRTWRLDAFAGEWGCQVCHVSAAKSSSLLLEEIFGFPVMEEMREETGTLEEKGLQILMQDLRQ